MTATARPRASQWRFFPMISKHLFPSLLVLGLSGCAALLGSGGGGVVSPPEFNQKVLLQVDDSYQMYQAPRSTYDIGDLQAFHSQHTFPLLVEEVFKELFGEVQLVEKEPQIKAGTPALPAVFEVRMLDLAHDIYTEANTYRAQVLIAVAMKSPDDEHIFWQNSFRGEGYVHVDPQFSTQLGPQDAVVDAVGNALEQMKEALVNSPEVRLQMKYYLGIEQARKEREVGS